MLIYSPDNRLRARLSETDDGVRVAFDAFSGFADRRGLNIADFDVAELSSLKVFWKQLQIDVIAQPFHVVRNHVVKLLSNQE